MMTDAFGLDGASHPSIILDLRTSRRTDGYSICVVCIRSSSYGVLVLLPRHNAIGYMADHSFSHNLLMLQSNPSKVYLPGYTRASGYSNESRRLVSAP